MRKEGKKQTQNSRAEHTRPARRVITHSLTYDTGLRQVLDHHAPLTTRRVSDRPSVSWVTEDIKAAKRELRRAESQRRATRLTVHREIYTKQRGVVKTFVRAARKLHFSARIENCSNTKQLFSVSSGLPGKSKTAPLLSDIPRSALLDRFCMFFSQKIQNIRQDLDAHPSKPATFSPYDGPKLCLLKSVTEEDIRKLIVESSTKTCMLEPSLLLSLKNAFLICCLLSQEL